MILTQLRRLLFCACFVAVGVSAADDESPRPRSRKGPISKVLLISIDTLRPDFLTAYDPDRPTSPNVAKLAASGTVFEDVVAQAGATRGSHQSIFSGLYTWIRGTFDNSVPKPDVELPVERLRASGLRTVAFTGGGRIAAKFGFDAGFERYVDLSRRRGPADDETPELTRLEEHALGWLDEHHDDDFFLFLHTYQVHCPYDPPERFARRFTDDYRGGFKCKQHQREKVDFEYVRALYAGEVAYVDEFLGRLFDKLDALEIADETMVVLLADHGEELGENDDRIGHSSTANLVLKVPLIVRVPGIGPSRVTGPAALIDVMPTIFSAVGLKPPYRFQGENLLPVMRGKRPIDPRRPRFASSSALHVAVYRGTYKAAFTEKVHGRLYDVRADPYELKNLGLSQPHRVTELERLWVKMLEDDKDLAALFVPAEPEVIDEELEQRLRALGYVD